MRPDWIAAAVAVGLMAACSRPAPVAPPAPVPAGMCRVGPDGGPDIADRGIGGTGAPVREAERGIGGTGGPVFADRGISGTGIVAVITGFASVCLAGQEVALPPDAAITIGGAPASSDALRAGQVAIVEAAGSGSTLTARRVMIRSEVSGPVEVVDGDRISVAGQAVIVGAGTWGARPAVGDWVVVSGLRRPDGTTQATRLDRRGPGVVIVHGKLLEDAGRLHIGELVVRPAPGLAALPGQDVTATGRIEAGMLAPDQVAPDLLATNPAALFGPAVGVFYVETFAVPRGGRVRFGQGFSAEARGLGLGGPGRAVLRLERGDGGLRAVGLAPAAASMPGQFGTAPAPGRQFEPAPVPNRAIRGLEGSPGRSGAGPGRGADRPGQRGAFRPGGMEGRGGDGLGPGPGSGPSGPPGR